MKSIDINKQIVVDFRQQDLKSSDYGCVLYIQYDNPLCWDLWDLCKNIYEEIEPKYPDYQIYSPL